MFLTFLGAAGTVTGSKTLVESGGHRFLLDCGLFQGPHEIRRRNWEVLPIEPNEIASVVLTHAHLDHCGYLPALVRDGFDGPVYCTPNTARLAAIVLRDSATLQEEDTAFATRKGYSKHAEPRPLYDTEDAEQAIRQFQPVEFHTDFHPAAGITARFDPAGHILGSAIVTVSDGERTVVFSGDLGRGTDPLLRPPAQPVGAHAIVLESTYGDREHADVDPELDRLAAAITRTLKRGGTVVIPAFAVDRTEVILKALHDLQDTHRIPKSPIHVDSPMALEAMRVYREAIVDGDDELLSSTVAMGPDIIEPGNLFESRTPDESKRLDAGGARIIVSASGMATGGRVVHHLKAFLPDPDSTIVLAGFQAAGTPGAALASGARQMKFHGQYVKVRAEVISIDAFSVHADASELLDWLRSADGQLTHVFVNHGEDDAARSLATKIEEDLDLVAVVPLAGERVAV